MEISDQLFEPYQFEPPPIYRELEKSGFFDFQNQNYLFLTDLEWLSLDDKQIYEYEHIKKDSTPFAQSARVDVFSWFPSLTTNNKIPIVFCPIGEDEGSGYAEDFTAFLYRILLEEFSGSWMVDSFGLDETGHRFRNYTETAKKYLPPQWGNTLTRLAECPLAETQPGVFGVFSRRECDLIIENSLAFPLLNKTIKYYE